MMQPQVRQCNRYLTNCQIRLADAHATRRRCHNAAPIGYAGPENENRRAINVHKAGSRTVNHGSGWVHETAKRDRVELSKPECGRQGPWPGGPGAIEAERATRIRRQSRTCAILPGH